jgi:hypothetical protein
MFKVYNTEQIVSIQLKPKTIVWSVEYTPEVPKKWFSKYKPEGFYYNIMYWISKTDLHNEGKLNGKDIEIIGNDVFYKPYIVINFTNGTQYYKSYNSYEKALDEFNNIKSKLNKTIITNEL